jgi:hypothetical protein
MYEKVKLEIGRSYMCSQHRKIDIVGQWGENYLVIVKGYGKASNDHSWVYDAYGEPMKGVATN